MRLTLENTMPSIATLRRSISSSGLDISGVSTFIVLGDSYSVVPAGGASDAAHSWVKLFEVETGKTINNQASTGRGIAYAVQRNWAVADVKESNEGIIVFAGFNDLRFTGATTKRINQIKHACRSLIASQFASSQSVPAGSYTSTNNNALFNENLDASNANGKANSFAVSGRRALTTSYGTDSVAGMQVLWNFTGDNVVIGYFGYDDAHAAYEKGTFQVYVDNVLKTTVDPAGQTDGNIPGYEMEQRHQPACLILSGLGAGAHTLKLIPLVHGVPKQWDWFGTLRPAVDCKPIFILTPSYQPDYVTGQSPFNNGSDVVMDAGKAAIQSVVNEFLAIDPLYPVVAVDVNINLNKATMFNADKVHRNDLGYANVFDNVMSNIR